jgi:prefoldin subunit 5
MATQAELAQSLNDIAAQVTKSKDEVVAAVAALNQKIADLEAAIAAGNGTTAEVDAAIEALKAQVQVLDDLNADASAP